MTAFTRLIAAFGALLALFGLVLQFKLLYLEMTADGASLLAIGWRFLAWFTLLTNAFVMLVWTRAALDPEARDGFNAPRVELMAATSILFVCVIYNLLLARLWDPQGWQKVADVILHNAVPPLFLLFWLLRPHGALVWRDAAFAAIWPLGYAGYGLIRGAFDGFYPYFFMDPATLSYGQIALNLAGLVAAFVLGALVLVAVSRTLARRRQPQI